MTKKNSGITTLGFRRTEFSFFKDMLVRISGVTALEGNEAQKSWSVFMDYLLKTQEQCIAVAESEARVEGGQHGWTGNSW